MLGGMKLGCVKCRKNFNSLHFCFDYSENTFYQKASREIQNKMQKMNQWCNACKAKEFKLLCCSECVEFLPRESFSEEELSKGIEGMCKKCKAAVDEGESLSDSIFDPKLSKTFMDNSNHAYAAKIMGNRELNLNIEKPKAQHHCKYCSKSGATLKCSRCRNAFYCSKECQKADWKGGHKAQCVPFHEEEGPKPLPYTSKFGLNVSKGQQKKIMKEFIDKAKLLQRNSATTFCTTCDEPTVCVDCFEKPGREVITASAIFVCKHGHRSVFTDVRYGLEQECTCDIKAKPPSPLLTPEQEQICRKLVCRDKRDSSDKRILIVTGFGKYDMHNSCYFEKLRPLLTSKQIYFDIVEAENSERFFARHLHVGNYDSLILLHLNEEGMHEMYLMFDSLGISTLYHWTRFGGKLILQGEGKHAALLLQDILGKPWHFCGDFYRRCNHSLNSDRFSPFSLRNIQSKRTESGDTRDKKEDSKDSSIDNECLIMPSRINMKAVMLSGVAPEEQLYSPKLGTRCVSGIPGFGGHIVPTFRTGIAASRYFEGLVVFIGDINAESNTIETMMSLIELPLEG